MGQGVPGWVASNQRIVRVADAYCDRRFDPTPDRALGQETRALLCVPLPRDRGVVLLANKLDGNGQPAEFDGKDEGLLQLICANIATSLDTIHKVEQQKAVQGQSQALLRAMLALGKPVETKEECIAAVLQQAAALINAQASAVFMLVAPQIYI